jgi:hypothetical protein
VIGDAAPLLGEDFDGKGKSVHQIRLAAIDAARKDEGLKTIVTIQVGDAALDKLPVATARKAFDTIVAMGAGRAATGDTDPNPELSRRIAGGDGAPVASRARYGRETMMARVAADSRRRGPAKEDGRAS